MNPWEHADVAAEGAEQCGTCPKNWGRIIIHEHTRVGMGFHHTALVAAHCPALKTGIDIGQTVPSALASSVSGALVRAGGYGITSRGPMRLLGNDVGPLSIWTLPVKGYYLSCQGLN